MSLIFIYGPPASGKLTIAKELASAVNYKLFHNHLTVDLLKSIFEFGSIEYRKLIYEVRINVIERALQNNIKLIFTYFYTYPDDNSFIELLLNKIEPLKKDIHFVQLLCDKNVLVKRIKSEERTKFQKLTDETILEDILRKFDYITPIPFVKTLSIDNSSLSPQEVVTIIRNNYDLGP